MYKNKDYAQLVKSAIKKKKFNSFNKANNIKINCNYFIKTQRVK